MLGLFDLTEGFYIGGTLL